MRTGGRGGGAPHISPIKIFEKLPHKNAIKQDPPPWFSHNPKHPPQKNLPENPQGPPWISNYCVSLSTKNMIMLQVNCQRISPPSRSSGCRVCGTQGPSRWRKDLWWTRWSVQSLKGCNTEINSFDAFCLQKTKLFWRKVCEKGPFNNMQHFFRTF